MNLKIVRGDFLRFTDQPLWLVLLNSFLSIGTTLPKPLRRLLRPLHPILVHPISQRLCTP